MQEKRNKQLFASEEYMQEEALVYSQLLEQMPNPSRGLKGENLKFLFFLKTDTLYGVEVDVEDEGYLLGSLQLRKLNLDDINQYDNLKVLYVPGKMSLREKERLDSTYREYRKEFHSTIEEITLTRVAFDDTYTRGFLQYSYDCLPWCMGGGGCGLYIKKVDGMWVIDKKGICAPPA